MRRAAAATVGPSWMSWRATSRRWSPPGNLQWRPIRSVISTLHDDLPQVWPSDNRSVVMGDRTSDSPLQAPGAERKEKRGVSDPSGTTTSSTTSETPGAPSSSSYHTPLAAAPIGYDACGFFVDPLEAAGISQQSVLPATPANQVDPPTSLSAGERMLGATLCAVSALLFYAGVHVGQWGGWIWVIAFLVGGIGFYFISAQTALIGGGMLFGAMLMIIPAIIWHASVNDQEGVETVQSPASSSPGPDSAMDPLAFATHLLGVPNTYANCNVAFTEIMKQPNSGYQYSDREKAVAACVASRSTP